MYCSLEDAFPEQATKKTRPTCWQKEPIVGAHVERAADPHFYQSDLNAKPAPRQLAEQPSHEQVCINSIHHCLSCAACQRLLFLHFQNHQPTVIGANVVQASSPQQQQAIRRRRIPLERPAAQAVASPPATTNNTGGAVNFLNLPISAGSPITWGHLLILLAGGAFLLLIMERLKK